MKILEIRSKDSCVYYLQAVGMGEGDELEVVRVAPFGGPIQVRLSGGAEFMLERSVAERMIVMCRSHVHPLSVMCGDHN